MCAPGPIRERGSACKTGGVAGEEDGSTSPLSDCRPGTTCVVKCHGEEEKQNGFVYLITYDLSLDSDGKIAPAFSIFNVNAKKTRKKASLCLKIPFWSLSIRKIGHFLFRVVGNHVLQSVPNFEDSCSFFLSGARSSSNCPFGKCVPDENVTSLVESSWYPAVTFPGYKHAHVKWVPR